MTCEENDTKFVYKKLQSLLKGDENKLNIFGAIEQVEDPIKNAEILIDQENYKAAENSIRKYLNENKKIPALELCAALTILGELWIRSKRYEEAIDCFRKSKDIRRTAKNMVGLGTAISLLGDVNSYKYSVAELRHDL